MGDLITGADIYLMETYWMMSVMHPEVAKWYPNIAKTA